MSNFEKSVINWVRADNEVREIMASLAKAREKRDELKDTLKESLDESQENSAVEIDNSRLRFRMARTAKPVSLKFVEKCLCECISDHEAVKKLMNYIKEQREYREAWVVDRTFFKTREAAADDEAMGEGGEGGAEDA